MPRSPPPLSGEYATTYAAQILGRVTPIYASDPEYQDGTLMEQGYDLDDKIGRSGVEKAFEKYLRGTDGTRVVSTNSNGKITGEFYSEQPEPGSTVELTIDPGSAAGGGGESGGHRGPDGR